MNKQFPWKEGRQGMTPTLEKICLEHESQEPCFECLEREEATAFWLDCKRKDRERLDEYCETYDYDDSDACLMDSQDSETEDNE